MHRTTRSALDAEATTAATRSACSGCRAGGCWVCNALQAAACCCVCVEQDDPHGLRRARAGKYSAEVYPGDLIMCMGMLWPGQGNQRQTATAPLPTDKKPQGTKPGSLRSFIAGKGGSLMSDTKTTLTS